MRYGNDRPRRVIAFFLKRDFGKGGCELVILLGEMHRLAFVLLRIANPYIP